MTDRRSVQAPPNKAKAFLRLVLIEHSVFALPFAYIAALTAMFLADRRVHWGSCCWSPSRWSACGPSRWPPTGSSTARSTPATRAPPGANWSPARSGATAYTGSAIALVVFLGAAALLNPLCLALAPVAVVPMVVYPYGKRFTDFPHAILGLAQACPGRRLAGRRPGRGPGTRWCSVSRSASGSAAST